MMQTINKTLLVKIASISPSSVLLGLLYVDNYTDFLLILPISWFIAYLYSAHAHFTSNSMRHFFSMLTLFVGYSVWGLFHLFPLPHFYDKSPFVILMILIAAAGLMMAFMLCCTRLYTVIEAKLLQCLTAHH